MDLGSFDEAAVELEQNARGIEPAAIADLYQRSDRVDRSFALSESAWKGVAGDIPLEVLPKEELTILYPAPYARKLIEHSEPRGVDPRLVLAIMRQESRFDPDVKSFAAARGLMQFISTTADQVAGELERNTFRQDDLYDPPTAILFGSHYLSSLFRLFPHQPEAVAASYNGGGQNMQRWLARARSTLPERYVAEIVYSQTKDYVQKVMANYRVYQYLYDEQLRPRRD